MNSRKVAKETLLVTSSSTFTFFKMYKNDPELSTVREYPSGKVLTNYKIIGDLKKLSNYYIMKVPTLTSTSQWPTTEAECNVYRVLYEDE